MIIVRFSRHIWLGTNTLHMVVKNIFYVSTCLLSRYNFSCTRLYWMEFISGWLPCVSHCLWVEVSGLYFGFYLAVTHSSLPCILKVNTLLLITTLLITANNIQLCKTRPIWRYNFCSAYNGISLGTCFWLVFFQLVKKRLCSWRECWLIIIHIIFPYIIFWWVDYLLVLWWFHICNVLSDFQFWNDPCLRFICIYGKGSNIEIEVPLGPVII